MGHNNMRGLFALPLFIKTSRHQHAITFWNARALFCEKRRQRLRKISLVGKLAASSKMVAIVETHGDSYSAARWLRHLRKENHILSVPGQSYGAAGMLVLIAKSWVSNRASMSLSTLLPGRVARVCVKNADATLRTWVVHNHGIKIDQAQLFLQQLEKIESVRSPILCIMRFLFLVIGTFLLMVMCLFHASQPS